MHRLRCLISESVSSTKHCAVAGAYEINGVNNPTLIVRRGQTYTLNLNTEFISSGCRRRVAISLPNYSNGFTGNSQTTGEHYWVVPEDAPDEIFYQCEFHPVMFGRHRCDDPA